MGEYKKQSQKDVAETTNVPYSGGGGGGHSMFDRRPTCRIEQVCW